MDVIVAKNLIKGVCVLIDDEVEEEDSSAQKLLTSLRDAEVPVVVFKEIPNETVIDSFGSISFIILDWDFTPSTGSLDEAFAEVQMGDAYIVEQKKTILEFLKVLLKKVFVPVFLITGQDFEKVKSDLSEASIYSEDKPNRIMVKTKKDVNDYESLIDAAKQWMEETPSAHVLKLWESEAIRAKNRMFLDLYNCSPAWVNVLLDVMEEDSKNEKAVNHDFSGLLNSIFTNRVHDAAYYSIENHRGLSPTANEVRRVLQGERFVVYEESYQPDVSYVGDLYRTKYGETYYINIRAQCNLIRENDPILYLLPGNEWDLSNLTKLPRIKMRFDNDKHILSIDQHEFCIEEMTQYKKHQKAEFNEKMQEYNSLLLFEKGEIIEKKQHGILSCIADK